MKLNSKILIIAGSDSSGGAGIQADIKTITALGSYAMTAITAVTSQNTTGINAIVPIPTKVISKQIEAARVALTRYMKRQGRVWTRVFPNIPVSKKPVEVRMGKGKGSPEFWACRVKPGRILFEVDGVSEEVAKIALYKASAKLPIKTKFIKR